MSERVTVINQPARSGSPSRQPNSHIVHNIGFNFANFGGDGNFNDVSTPQQVEIDIEEENGEPCEDGTVIIEVREGILHVNGVRTASNNVDIKIRGSVGRVQTKHSSLRVTGDVKGNVECKNGSIQVGGDVLNDIACAQGSVRVHGNVGGDTAVNMGSLRIGSN